MRALTLPPKDSQSLTGSRDPALRFPPPTTKVSRIYDSSSEDESDSENSVFWEDATDSDWSYYDEASDYDSSGCAWDED
ncbi:hypothetical protein VNI00_012109 [Paramarasmius palmivorus]|uniref:Uncharacterized protein n=1 Tax=Paramarasmius palmivorus TaxID=297713 RepID=A0AAW0C804_9AGAR